MAEAKRRDRSIPKVKSEKDALEWIAYRGTPFELPPLVSAHP